MDKQSKQVEAYKKQMFVQQIQRYMPKSIFQTIYEKSVRDLLKHMAVNCPKCGEVSDLFTTSGVLPELTGCKTGMCSKCNTDFYYLRGSCYYETFTPKDLEEFIEEN